MKPKTKTKQNKWCGYMNGEKEDSEVGENQERIRFRNEKSWGGEEKNS